MSVVSNSSSHKTSKIASIHPIESEEELIVGDKVFIVSNPEKTGAVAYYGTTHFSDGIWVGVSLDRALGKNNGSVQGKMYFKCEENHGIFVRKNNLKKLSVKSKSVIKQSNNSNSLKTPGEEINILVNTAREKDDGNEVFAVPNAPTMMPRALETSATNFNATLNALGGVPGSVVSSSNLSLGERVVVLNRNGTATNKVGTLRFIGCTKFSDGVWVGLELDNPLGKNDGSVDGIRYFSCKRLYGLFAQEHKVQRFDPTKHSRPYTGSNRIDSSSFSRQGSCESLASVASNFSSASRTRVRLGMNAVGNTPNKTSTEKNQSTLHKTRNVNMSKTKENEGENVAMQKVLKEKEQHIEQLMREREIEQVNLSEMSGRVEEMSTSLTVLSEERTILDKKIGELQSANVLLGQEREMLIERLEEEKKRVEDLLFRMEEKNIDECDLENKTEESESQIFELHEKLAYEKEQKEILEKRLQELQNKTINNKNSNNNCDDDVNNVAASAEVGEREKSPNVDENIILELKNEIQNLQEQIAKEKNNSKITILNKSLDQRTAEYNNIKDRYSELKAKFEEQEQMLNSLNDELNQMKSMQSDDSISKLNLQNDNRLLNAQSISQSKVIEELTLSLEEAQSKLKILEIEKLNAQSQTLEGAVRDAEEFRSMEEELRQKIEKLNEELLISNKNLEQHDKVVAELKSETDNSKTELQQKTLQVTELTKRINVLELENSKLTIGQSKFSSEREEMAQNLASTYEQLAKLRNQVNDLHVERQKQLTVQAEMETRNSLIKAEVTELTMRIDFLEKENAILSENNSEIDKDLYDQQINQMKANLQEMGDNLRKEKEENLILITKNATLYSEYEKEKGEIEEKYAGIIERVEILEEQKVEMLNEFEKYRGDTNEKKEELMIIRERLLKVTQEHETLQDSYSNLNQKYDMERKINLEKIRKLERQLEESEKKSLLSDGPSDKKRSESKDVTMLRIGKENAEQQISFLNSVIAEREKKFKIINEENEQLRIRLKDMENGNIPPVEQPIPKKIHPPRLYCDVCEMFDLHDTDDCTKLNEPGQSPNSNKLRLSLSKKHQVPLRLYCDICEIFDAHNTSDCHFEESF